MEQLLSLLKTIPEYKTMLSALENGQSVAVTGIGQINRSHMIAGLRRESKRPMVLLCQDDMAARRLQEELKCFLGTAAPILPSRELTLYDAAVVSRAWEQKRLRQLYDLATGNTNLQILSWESLSMRTMPKEVLLSAAFTLEVGTEYPLEELIAKLVADKLDIDIHHASLTEERVQAMHKAGITINCWTVDTAERGEELAAWGVDQITSNILEGKNSF